VPNLKAEDSRLTGLLTIMCTPSRNVQNDRHLRANPPLARPLILVADDDEDTRVMFRTILELQGYRVIEAPDGEKAVQMAQRARPDLILMDTSLPGVDGFNATRRIRGFGGMPIVFVSGHAEARFLAQAREAGCNEYLVKPINLDRLDEVIKKYISQTTPALGAF
jgi:two-component system, cell cycle response regulator DivK